MEPDSGRPEDAMKRGVGGKERDVLAFDGNHIVWKREVKCQGVITGD